MRIEPFKKIKNYIGYILFVVTFVGMGDSIDATGHKLSYIESFILAMIVYTINRLMWSDWMYNYLKNEGKKISNIIFQKIGIFVSVLLIVVLGAASYTGHTNNNSIDVGSGFILTIVLYFLIMFIGEKWYASNDTGSTP